MMTSRMTMLKEEMKLLSAMASHNSIIRLCGSGALFVSTAVVGKLGSEELSAAAYACAVIQLTQCFFVDGANGAMSTLVSQVMRLLPGCVTLSCFTRLRNF
jgi:Na+-driven multidrug efflux pump